MKKMILKATHLLLALFALCSSVVTFQSCIEPPLKLPAEEVLVDLQTNVINMDIVWSIDADWKNRWYYGWDKTDSLMWGPLAYPTPSSYEVRRYYLGQTPNTPHKNVEAFTINTNRFRRSYLFGYYDLLIWSNIDSEDGTQVVKIEESNLDEITATTTVTRGMTRLTTAVNDIDDNTVVGLYNQPEIFYSTYPRNIYISDDLKDYDYYDEEEKCWVKQIDCELTPLVYIYLVQVIFLNNDGRIVGTSGNAALSAFTGSTNVNTGHTHDNPAMVYFNTRFKSDMLYHLQGADIIGGKLTTYGLCDMASYLEAPDHKYNGSRKDLPNYLMVDISFRNGKEKTYQFNVTDQCWDQAHGGIITVVIDCNELDMPEDDPTEPSGSLFVPTVEDYDEVVFEIPLDYTINKK